MKRALITGIAGQDGSYLAELLLSKGYCVHGTVRRSSSFNTPRIDHILGRLHLHYADITDPASILNAVQKAQPDEVYNLAAQSHVRVSFDMPAYTFETVALGTVHLIDAVLRLDKPCRFYQASSSEMFGNAPAPQNEQTPFRPLSPYAVAKLAAHHSVMNAREGRGLWASCGILFNHESERRGPTFVTRKITRAVTRISLGLQDKLYLGNLDAKRDWGYAADYIEAMWLMLQNDEPDDFVIATGESVTVERFLKCACDQIDMDWVSIVETDPRLFRPSEVNELCGDASKAERVLGWRPTVRFPDLVKRMVAADLNLAETEAFACSL